MPRNNTSFGNKGTNTTFSKPAAAHHIMPRMSYTGAIMPRAQPIDVKPASFGQSIKEGFSFGFGASIARNVVDRWFGTSTSPVTPPISHVAKPVISTPSKTPLEEQIAYQQCLKDGGDHEKCKDYLI